MGMGGMGGAGYRLVEHNCLSCGIPISHKVFCFALAADSLGSKASFHSGSSSAGVITFLLIVLPLLAFQHKVGFVAS